MILKLVRTSRNNKQNQTIKGKSFWKITIPNENNHVEIMSKEIENRLKGC